MLILLLLSACFRDIKEFKFKNIDKVDLKMLEMKELGIGSAFDFFKNDLLDLLKRSEMPEDRGLITKLLKNESNKFLSQLNEVEDSRLSELLRYSALTSNSIFFNIIEILNKKDLLEKTLLERDSRGRTALHFAFLSKNFVLCEYLLKYSPLSCRSQLVATDDCGLNCLYYLAFADLFEEYVEGSKENTIKFKLERNKFKNFSEYLALLSNDTIVEKDEKGLTPMHYAAYFGNLDLCKSILKHSNQEKTELLSAKSERVKDLGELTPLDLAYLANEVDMIDYLEKEIKIYEGKGTKVFKLDDKNRIFKCALRSSLKTGEFALVDRYFKNYYSSKDTRKDYTKLSKESLLHKDEKNRDLNCLGEKIRSLEASLMIDEEINEEIMEILTILQKSVDLGINNELIYSEDADGKTSIHLAVNNTNILEILYSYSLKTKVIKSVKDKLGRSPLHYASLSPKSLKSIEVIKKFSPADILIVDNEGNTPLDIAIKNNLVEVVDTLLRFNNLGKEQKSRSLRLMLKNLGLDKEINLNILKLILDSGIDFDNLENGITLLENIIDKIREYEVKDRQNINASSLWLELIERYDSRSAKDAKGSLLNLLILNNMEDKAIILLDKINLYKEEDLVIVLKISDREGKGVLDLLVESGNIVLTRKLFEIYPIRVRLEALGFRASQEETLLFKALKERKFNFVFEVLRLKKEEVVENLESDDKTEVENSIAAILNNIVAWTKMVDEVDLGYFINTNNATSLFIKACLELHSETRNGVIKEKITADQRMDLAILASFFKDINMIEVELNSIVYVWDSLVELVFSDFLKDVFVIKDEFISKIKLIPKFFLVAEKQKRLKSIISSLSDKEKYKLLVTLILSKDDETLFLGKNLMECVLDNLNENKKISLFKRAYKEGRSLLHFAFLVQNYDFCNKLFDLKDRNEIRKILQQQDKQGATCLHYLAFSDLIRDYENEKARDNKAKNLLPSIYVREHTKRDTIVDLGQDFVYYFISKIEENKKENSVLYKTDVWKRSALHYALYFKNKSLYSVILEGMKCTLLKEYKVTEEAIMNLNVLQLAYLLGDIETINILESSVNIPGNMDKISNYLNLDRTDLSKYALRNGNFEIMKLYLDNCSILEDNSREDAFKKEIGNLSFQEMILTYIEHPFSEALDLRNRLHVEVIKLSKERITSVEQIGKLVYLVDRAREIGGVHEFLNTRDEHGDKAIHLAANNEVILRILYATREFDGENNQNKMDKVPLHLAVENSNIEAIKVIKKFAVNEINVENAEKKTPLYLALLNNFEECLKALFEFGINKEDLTKVLLLMLRGNNIQEDIGNSLISLIDVDFSIFNKGSVILETIIETISNGNILNEQNQKLGRVSSYIFCIKLVKNYKFDRIIDSVTSFSPISDTKNAQYIYLLLHLLILNQMDLEVLRLLDKLKNFSQKEILEVLSFEGKEGKSVIDYVIIYDNLQILKEIWGLYSEELKNKSVFPFRTNFKKRTVIMKSLNSLSLDCFLYLLEEKKRICKQEELREPKSKFDPSFSIEDNISKLFFDIYKFVQVLKKDSFELFSKKHLKISQFVSKCLQKNSENETKSCSNLMELRKLEEFDKIRIILAASFLGDVDSIHQFCSENSQLNSRFNDMTALMFATYNEKINVIEFLHTHKVDINAADRNGRTSLMYASVLGFTDLARNLIEAGANLNLENKMKMNALMYATQFGHQELLELLISKKSKVDVIDEDGTNLLMWAAKMGHTKVLEYLLEKTKLDIYYKDKNRKTLFDIAKEKGDENVLKLLAKIKNR